MATEEERKVTDMGNPAKPTGAAGAEMLARMNDSHAPVTEWGLSHISVAADARVLDIGCGGGATLRRLAARAPQGHITGMDYSPVSVACSAELNRAAVESGLMQVLEGSVEAMPFADDSFDTITTVESFYFWPDPQENLREVYRVLKPGGTFLLIADIHEDGALPATARENISRYRLFNPTQEQFRELFRAAGFTRTAIHTKEGEHWIAVCGAKD
ncbi:MAG: class I SAM-dependent methyltransferase [Akkermansia sp.]|nr:class I SAM-dependent methyltransferase [Akkermansia sp.]